jgi:hypothetical protein
MILNKRKHVNGLRWKVYGIHLRTLTAYEV